MKLFLTFLIALVMLTSCSEHETTYRVATELQPYVDAFYAEAGNASKNLVAELKQIQSTTNVEITNDQHYFYFNTSSFNAMKASGEEEQIMQAVYIGLGKVLLKKNVSPFVDPTVAGQLPTAKTFAQIKAEIFN